MFFHISTGSVGAGLHRQQSSGRRAGLAGRAGSQQN
jgi:hypothetical protein